ncbi:MAG: hypothetical protein ACOVSW_03150 [Candidatus Kapaibacteriota bacterium]
MNNALPVRRLRSARTLPSGGFMHSCPSMEVVWKYIEKPPDGEEAARRSDT